MLILDQKKEKIYNFSFGIIAIKFCIIRTFSVQQSIVLAEYLTEARAKEVLKDIIKKAEAGCNTYIMPEE